MAHAETHSSYKREAHRSHMEKTERLAMGGASDSAEDKAMVRKAIRQHETHDHPGKGHTALKLKDGGHVDGKHSKARMDRPGRKHLATGGGAGMGKKDGKGNHVNVIVAGGQGAPRPVPVQVPVGGPPGAGMGMAPPMPPRPPMGPPPGGGMPMPPGAMPHARGGRTYARGGKVEMDGGASGGLGRIEKIKDYGKPVPAGEDHGDTADLENMSMSDGDKENQKTR